MEFDDGLADEDLEILASTHHGLDVDDGPTSQQTPLNGFQGLNQNPPEDELEGEILDDGKPIEPPSQRFRATQAGLKKPSQNEKQLREQFRAARYASQRLPAANSGAARPSQAPSRGVSLPLRQSSQSQTTAPNGRATHGPPGVSVAPDSMSMEELRRQLEEALRAKDQLQADLQSANDLVFAKSGEIAILRANFSKTVTERDRRLTELQKQQNDLISAHRAEIDEAQREKAKLATDNQFMNHDQFVAAARGPRRPAKNTQQPSPSGTPVPRNGRLRPLGDGFADLESASFGEQARPRDGARDGVNAGREKRRRTEQSPVQSQRQSFPDDGFQFIDEPVEVEVPLVQAPVVNVGIDSSRQLRLLQKLLNHKSSPESKRTIEILSDFQVDINGSKATLSSIIYERLSAVEATEKFTEFGVACITPYLEQWTQCLETKYFEPLNHLMEVVDYMAQNYPQIIPEIMDRVVLLCQKTADINIIPRYKSNRRRAANAPPEVAESESSHVSTALCLKVLLDTSLGASHDPEYVERFWKQIRFDFISLILRPYQDLVVIELLLQLLATSIRDETFAMIVAPPASQSICEQHVIDRLTLMLLENAKNKEGKFIWKDEGIARTRVTILDLMRAMLMHDRTTVIFISHPNAFARLVRFMFESLEAMLYRPVLHQFHAELVNSSVALIHAIVMDNEGFTLQEKLKGVLAGEDYWRVGLTQIAYLEKNGFTEHIEDETVQMAYDMLVESVQPDELASLVAPFEQIEGDGETAQSKESEAVQADIDLPDADPDRMQEEPDDENDERNEL